MGMEYTCPAGVWRDSRNWSFMALDLLADVCKDSDMFAPTHELPKEIHHWTRTRTDFKSCTIRGVDWECVKARNACKAAGTDISPLTSEAVVKRVLETPESRECIRTQDWVQLEKVSGVRTNACALYALYQRCITAGLQYPHLQACGLSNLRSGLRTRAHNAAACLHGHRPPFCESNLGQVHSQPAPHVGPTGTHEIRMVSMSDVDMGVVPAPVGLRARCGTLTEERERRS